MEEEKWLQRLIREESSPSAAFFNESLEAEEATETFLRRLKVLFSQAAAEFNRLNKNGPSIYVYKITNIRAGFMLYRAGFRLLFFYEAAGKIRIRAVKTSPGKNQEELLSSSLQAFRNNPLSAFKWRHESHSGFVDAEPLVSCYFQFLARAGRKRLLKQTEVSKSGISSFL